MWCRFALSIIVLLILLSPLTHANESSHNTKVFSIGVEDYENWLPYSQFKNGIYEGLGKDILDLFAKKKGYIFRYEVYPLKRRDRMFVNQQLDFSFPDNPSWVTHLKKGLKIKYTPVLEFTDGVMVLPENKDKGLESLKSLGIPLGFTPYQYLELIQTGQIQEYHYPNYDSLYHKVQLKHIDGAYMNIDIAKYYIAQNSGNHQETPLTISFDPSLPHAKGFWHLASIKHPQIIYEFTRFMQEHYDEIKVLREKYDFDPKH